MAEAGRPARDGLVQPLCSEMSQLEQVAQDSLGFKHLQSWRFENLCGCSTNLTVKVLSCRHPRKSENYKNTSDTQYIQEGLIYVL